MLFSHIFQRHPAVHIRNEQQPRIGLQKQTSGIHAGGISPRGVMEWCASESVGDVDLGAGFYECIHQRVHPALARHKEGGIAELVGRIGT